MYRQLVESEQRLGILQLLKEDPGYSHNEGILKSALGLLGHQVSSDLMRNHLSWLEEQGLVKLNTDTDVWVAQLTQRGDDVATGSASLNGVARPRPGA